MDKSYDKDVTNINIYYCGLTPYTDFHIGHFRGPIVWDVVAKIKEKQGHKITVVSNVTDVSGEIYRKSKAEEVNDWQLSQKYFLPFKEKVAELTDFPIRYVYISDVQEQIVHIIEEMVKNQEAFITEEGVFEKSTGFILWKIGEGNYPSPWGIGRVGWHIGCVAAISSIFGYNETIHYHGGGNDLEMHHINEDIVFKSYCSSDNNLSEEWIRHGLIFPGGSEDKFSKSKKNYPRMDEIDLNRSELRLLMVYRKFSKDFEYNKTNIEEAKNIYKKLSEIYLEASEEEGQVFPIVKKEMNNFNIREAITQFLKKSKSADKKDISETIRYLTSILF